MPNLRIGVVGAGVMGSGHMEYLSQDVAGADVCAVAEPNSQLRESVISSLGLQCSQWDSLTDMLDGEDLDGVVVASPDRFHASSIEECISRDMPLLCEKPLAENLQDAERVAAAHANWVHSHGRHLVHLGFMRRFDAPYRQAKQIIESGELGDVLYINASTRNVNSPEVTSEQLLTNIAVHEIDTMRWLLDAEWSWLSVNPARPTRHAPSNVSDPIVLTGSMANQVFVVADVFANNTYGYDVRTEITLEGGVIRIGIDGNVTIVRNHTVPGLPGLRMVDNWIPRFRNAYVEELRAWVAGIKGEQHPDLATVDDGLETVKVLNTLLPD